MATTINAYSVGLSLNASSYIRNSQLSRSETSALVRAIESVKTPAEKYSESLSRLDRALREGAISQETYNRLVKQAQLSYRESTAEAKKATGALDKFGRSVTNLALSYLSLNAAMRTGTWAVRLAADAEQAQIAFEVLMKDGDKAEKLVAQLRSFAAATPFRSDEIINAGRKLLAFGVAANDVSARLHMMGNISAATGIRIEEMAEIVGKMRVQGRIMSEDINQLTGRGINVIDGLAKKLGVAASEVKNMASQGKIQFEDLLAVLQQLSEKDFGGMMERQAEAAAGKFSTLRDSIDEVGRSLGKIATDTKTLDFMQFIVDKYTRQFADGAQFISDMAKGNTAKLKVAQAEAENIESALLLADIKAGRETQRVSDMRKRSEALRAKFAKQRLADEQQAAKLAKESESAKQRAAERYQESLRRQAAIQEQVKETAQAALDKARRHIEQERQRQTKMRQDIQSMMSGAGAEVGSGSDIAYNAQRANEAIARTLVQPQSTPTDEELLAESKRQLMELQQQTRQNNALLMAVQKLVEKTPQLKRMG